MEQNHFNLPTLLGVAAVSVISGYLIGNKLNNTSNKSIKSKQPVVKSVTTQIIDSNSEYEDEEEEEEFEINSTSLNEVPGEVRLALVIRQDLGMTKGKIAAQCCHATLSCFRLIGLDSSKQSYNPTMVNRWLSHGQAKITLKCPDASTMDELYAKAISLGINASIIHDAGRTQIAAGSATVLGLGPAPKSVLDQVTGELKLY